MDVLQDGLSGLLGGGAELLLGNRALGATSMPRYIKHSSRVRSLARVSSLLPTERLSQLWYRSQMGRTSNDFHTANVFKEHMVIQSKRGVVVHANRLTTEKNSSCSGDAEKKVKSTNYLCTRAKIKR